MILLSGLDILVALANAVAGVTLAAPLLLRWRFDGGYLTGTFVTIGLAVFIGSIVGAARRNACLFRRITREPVESASIGGVDSYRSGNAAMELRPRVHRVPRASRNGGRRSLRTA